jgi:hypothetical protein
MQVAGSHGAFVWHSTIMLWILCNEGALWQHVAESMIVDFMTVTKALNLKAFIQATSCLYCSFASRHNAAMAAVFLHQSVVQCLQQLPVIGAQCSVCIALQQHLLCSRHPLRR